MSIQRLLLTLTLAAASTAAAYAGVPPSTAPLPSSSPAAASSNPPAAEDPAITAQVKAQYAAWQAGKIDRKLYSADINAKMTDAIVTNVSTQLQSFGTPTAFTFLDKSVVQGNTVYTYGVDDPKGKLQMLYALDKENKISGIFFRPAP